MAAQSPVPRGVMASISPVLAFSDGGGRAGLAVTLLCGTVRPAEVTAMIYDGPGNPAVWTFGRDLLEQGLSGPSGPAGGVSFWPEGQEALAMRIESPDGTAAFELPASRVRAFLEESAGLAAAGPGGAGASGPLDEGRGA